MSSNIRIQRICEYCDCDFIAKTTVTKYCSESCAKKGYKAGIRLNKIAESNSSTLLKMTRSLAELQAKEYLTVRETAILLGCSVRSVYYYIENGIIDARNLSGRMTRIRRSGIDKLFTKI